MPTAADQLDAFVDRTDDDRLRAALAGESPARFRGRIIMERAAWLVRTSGRTLLEIALDSGFSGQATFASAFRREFGVLPSVWRAEPTSHVIDAPGEAHFHPPAGLLLPARQRVDGADLVVILAEHHVGTVADLVELAGLVSADELDRPAAGGSLRSALTGLVDRMDDWNALVRPGGSDDPQERTGREGPGRLGRRLARVGPEFVDNVARIASAGRLDEAVVGVFSPAPTVSSHAAAVAGILADVGHARSLAVARLDACGVRVHGTPGAELSSA